MRGLAKIGNHHRVPAKVWRVDGDVLLIIACGKFHSVRAERFTPKIAKEERA
jgi:hypothetical protein